MRGRGTPRAWELLEAAQGRHGLGRAQSDGQELGRRVRRRVIDRSEDEGKHVLTPEQKGAGKRVCAKGQKNLPGMGGAWREGEGRSFFYHLFSDT